MFYTVKITDFGLSKAPPESLGKEGMVSMGLGLGYHDDGCMGIGLEDGGRVVMGLFCCCFLFNVVES